MNRNNNSRHRSNNNTNGGNGIKALEGFKDNSLANMDLSFIGRYYNAASHAIKNKDAGQTRVEKAEKTGKDKSEKIVDQVIYNQAILDDFTDDYMKNKTDIEFISNLVRDNIISIAEIMSNYFDHKYAAMVESMNNVLKLTTTKTFAITLFNLVKSGEDAFIDWEHDKLSIAQLISLALETNHNLMNEDTKLMYVELILEHIWNFEIRELQTKFYLTEDAALDLVIGIPKFGKDMTKVDIRNCYDSYVTMLFNHGRCAIDYLNAEHQKELFYYLFKDDNRIAITAAAYLMCEHRVLFDEAQDQLLYDEYCKMLYEVVDEHDFEDIRIVLKMMTNILKKDGVNEQEYEYVFDVDMIQKYPNIKRAWVDFVGHNADARKYLVTKK